MADQPSINAWLSQAKQRLATSGADAPDLDAKLMLCEITGLSSAQLISRSDVVLDCHAIEKANSMLTRRLSGEPLHRILQWREFYGRRFDISPETLIPRPDTETLIDSVLATVGDRSASLKILDMGTGTGNIGVTLAAELPSSHVIVADFSREALKTAVKNAGTHGVAGRVTAVHTDLFDTVTGSFDLLVSNPPYIPVAELDGLQPEVRLHEPHRALLGGEDGMFFYERIFGEAMHYLEPEGQIFIEIGAGQEKQVELIANRNGFAIQEVFKDLSGIVRVLRAVLR
ncbi:MAG: peptide chain release factor N(5)-glutamine methyltransferase [Pseudomonadota bacterium]